MMMFPPKILDSHYNGDLQIGESGRFLKKAAQKLLLCWAVGVVGGDAHDPD
jgi:hypothetical protein